jgi:hypothetical protein
MAEIITRGFASFMKWAEKNCTQEGGRSSGWRPGSFAIYWSVRESGLTGISLARRYQLTHPSIVHAVQRGEKIAREGNYQLLN